jgi:hypothetical protein
MMRKTAAAIVLISCRALFAGNPYFPLELGNRWTYQSQFLISVNTFTETVVEEKLYDQESYFIFDNFRLQTSVPFRAEGQKVYTFVDGVKYLMYDFSAEAGTSWNSPDPPQPIMGRMTLVGKTDSVDVPGGAFVNCFHFHHSFGGNLYFDEWFAPGVGIVRKDSRLLSGLIKSVLIDHQVETAVSVEPAAEPARIRLHANFPNPFNSSTTVSFEAPRGERVRVQVLDCGGRVIAGLFEGSCESGVNRVAWNTSDLHSGVYFIRMSGGRFSRTRKAVLQK